MERVQIELVVGDLLDQETDVIVNAWNRNIIPWWLLLPQGVSGAIKRRAGIKPFRELSKAGRLPLGGACLTGAGRLAYKGIIHVAGINMLWRSSEKSIRGCVRSAMDIVAQEGYESIAFPVIGAGSGGMKREKALEIMTNELEGIDTDVRVTIVKYEKTKREE